MKEHRFSPPFTSFGRSGSPPASCGIEYRKLIQQFGDMTAPAAIYRWPARKPLKTEVNMMKVLAVAPLSLLFVGCADTQPTTLGTDHPGNAAAPEAPSPEPSRTLNVTEPVLAPSQAATASGGHDLHHHDMGGMNVSAAPTPFRARPRSS